MARLSEQHPAFEVQALTVHYGKRQIVGDVTLTASTGTLTVLLGGNGAGKTTLLKACAGLLPASSGTIHVAGKTLNRLSLHERARHIAYLPQFHRPAFPFPVHEVVLMGRWPHSSALRGYGEADRQAADQALDLVGMGALAHRPYTAISGGERQLVLIARALAQEAKILIFDEPETGLDVGHRQRLLQLLRRLADRGHAVFISSHFPDNAVRFADQAALLADNRLLAAGSPRAVLTAENIWKMYQVEITLPDRPSRC